MKHWTKISLAVAALFAWWLSGQTFFATDRMGAEALRNYLGIIAQVSATMLGFLIAALSILATISGHRLLRNMRITRHYHVMLVRFFANAGVFGVTAIIAIAAILLRNQMVLAAQIVTVLFFFSWLLLADVSWRFWITLSNLSPTKEQ